MSWADPVKSTVQERQPGALGGSKHFRGRRWLNISLRSLHLVGVVQTGVAILAHGQSSFVGIALMLSTGLALYGLEWWPHRYFWRELAGMFGVVKLLTLLAMLVFPDGAQYLFWFLLIASSVVSHAPWSLRHRKMIG